MRNIKVWCRNYKGNKKRQIEVTNRVNSDSVKVGECSESREKMIRYQMNQVKEQIILIR